MTSDLIWIFNFRGALLEVAVSPDNIVTRADSPMEWAVGEKWEVVRNLFEALGTLSLRDHPS